LKIKKARSRTQKEALLTEIADLKKQTDKSIDEAHETLAFLNQ
jgi:hypothetical protein